MGWHVGAPALLLAMSCGRSCECAGNALLANTRISYLFVRYGQIPSPRFPLFKLKFAQAHARA